ncbi:MAG: hypothetical protein ACHBN1_16565 [Heteroscytonema crispum UTEX LB 1556]
MTLVPRYREALHQSPGSGKRHLRPLGRPQDRSGGPTKGAKRSGGNLPDCRLRAPSPLTINRFQIFSAIDPNASQSS